MTTIATKMLSFSLSKPRVPIVLQNELAECGLACLAMISSFHGHVIGLEGVRNLIQSSTKGIRLNDLLTAAAKLHLSPRVLRIEPNQLSSLRCPAILHWNLDHFVVVIKTNQNHIYIHDPACGKKCITMQQVGRCFTGIAVEMTPTQTFTKYDETLKVRLSTFWRSAVGLKRAFLQILLLSFTLQFFALVTPFFMQITVDHILLSEDMDLLGALALGFAILVVFQMLTDALRSWMVLYLNSTLDIQLVSNTLHHVLRLPLGYFEKRFLGDIMSRFGSLRSVRQLFVNGLIESILDGIMAITTLALMFLYNSTLAIVVLTAVIIYFNMRLLLYRHHAQIKQESLILNAKEVSNFMETIRAILPIKLYAKESQREAIWKNRYASALNGEIRMQRMRIVYEALNKTLFPLAAVLVIWLGAKNILQSTFTVGMLYAFFAYQEQFKQRACALADKIFEFTLARVDLDRVGDIVYAKQEDNIENGTSLKHSFDAHIEVNQLSFRYDKGEPLLLKDVNVSIAAGESVAIVGPSGCGKTTLAKLMVGLLSPESGQVLFGGIDLEKINKQELRQITATVMQEDCLLSGTIADNITFFDPHPNLSHAYLCAQHAAIHADIITMPMGYNTLVGDMGTSLSGGQRQRILIARALYANPKLLVLDEASSHLDSETEQRINTAIGELPITRIIIAHRENTINMADRVIKLEIQTTPPNLKTVTRAEKQAL